MRPTSNIAPGSRLRRTAISMAPEPRTRMAARGRAIRVISEPKLDTVAAPHTRRKAELLQSGELKG